MKAARPLGLKAAPVSAVDPIPMVEWAQIDVRLADGSRAVYVIHGMMRAQMTSKITPEAAVLGFEFENPSHIEEVYFDAPEPGDVDVHRTGR